MKNISFIIIISFIFSHSIHLIGQSDITQSSTRAAGEKGRYQDKNYFQRKQIAIKNIKSLKDGTLIVRLVSYKEKIDLLTKKGNLKKAEELQLEANTVNTWFIKQFIVDYNFSDVVYCYGIDLKEYLEGKKKDIFLNENLEVDSNISIKEGPIYIFASQASDSYYLFDKEYNRIPEPAPHAINQEVVNYKRRNKENTGRNISLDRFLEIFSGVRANPLEDSVKYFNAKLIRLYNLDS